MKICFHSHCFPDALAPRAVATLAENAKRVGMTPHTDGTAAGTLRYLRASGIDTALICNIATNPHQEHKVNDFAVMIGNILNLLDLKLFNLNIVVMRGLPG